METPEHLSESGVLDRRGPRTPNLTLRKRAALSIELYGQSNCTPWLRASDRMAVLGFRNAGPERARLLSRGPVVRQDRIYGGRIHKRARHHLAVRHHRWPLPYCEQAATFAPQAWGMVRHVRDQQDDPARSLRNTTWTCTRAKHHLNFWLLIGGGMVMKIGQLPSLADLQQPQVQKCRKLLGEQRFKELNRAVGLAAHGVGNHCSEDDR